MVVKAISFVAEEPNKWDGPNGTIYFVNGSFHDGDTFSIGSKSEADALDHRSALANLLDQDHDFVLEDGKPRGEGKTGIKWKFGKPGYPGDPREPYGYKDSSKPAPAPSGAPVPQNGPSRDDQISRAVALKAAANFCSGLRDTQAGPFPVDGVLTVADVFLEWLTSAAPDSPSVAEVGSEVGVGSPSSGAGTAPTSTSDWEGDQAPVTDEVVEYLRKAFGGPALTLVEANKRYDVTALGQLTAAQADEMMESKG